MTIDIDTDALLAEFAATRDTRRQCKVCESEYRELIDRMLRVGGAPTVRRFLIQRLGVEVASSTLHRHKSEHVNVGSRPEA